MAAGSQNFYITYSWQIETKRAKERQSSSEKGLLLVLVLILALPLGAFAFQNEPDGFRGLKWGDPPTEDMEYFDTIEGNQSYVLFEEKNSFGDVELEQIFYVFYGDPGRFFQDVIIQGKICY